MRETQFSLSRRPASNHPYRTLEWATGWKIGLKDATDDRLADLLKLLGSSKHQAIETIETKLGQHLIRAYELPTETQPRPKILLVGVANPPIKVREIVALDAVETDPPCLSRL